MNNLLAQAMKNWEDIPGAIIEEPLSAGGTEKLPTFKALEAIFSNILTIATMVAGLAVFIILIIGGLNFLTSGGDPEKVKKATAMITSAIAGLVILIAAWFIIRLIEQFTGVTITQFEIPGL